MVRRFSTRRQALPSLCAAFVLGVLLSAAASGCSQSPQESGGERAGGRDATTQAGTTSRKETTALGEATQAPPEQRLQKAQEQAQQQREQARQQRQQAQQRDQQQSQQGREREQQGQQTVTVRVTGTGGLPFSGRVGSAQEMRRVEGNVPEEYELPSRGAVVNAALRKQEPGEGTLGVEVLLDGEVVAGRETSTMPGVLNLVWTSR